MYLINNYYNSCIGIKEQTDIPIILFINSIAVKNCLSACNICFGNFSKQFFFVSNNYLSFVIIFVCNSLVYQVKILQFLMENIQQQNFSFTIQKRSTPKQPNHSQSHFSIIPDLITGWRPKSFNISPPILVKYKQNLVANLISSSKNKLDSLIYLGSRHYNSFSFHNKTKHEYNVRYCVKSQDLPLKFQQQLQKYQKEEVRPFVGMNSSIESDLIFDSNFESGNLDAVIQINQNQYDLFLRPDTNTCGHTQWFYFSVNFKQKDQSLPNKKVKFNICNNKKYKTLFCKGMKPYILSDNLKQKEGVEWHQTGFNVQYKKYVPRQNYQQKTIQRVYETDSIREEQDEISNQKKQNCQNQEILNPIKKQQPTYFCLSFEYQFSGKSDLVHFAYCPPYTYSNLKKDLVDLKKKTAKFQNCQVIQEKLCESLSGVDVPLLTITDPTAPEQQKRIIIGVARFHPGQPNGSHVMKGFLQYLVSQEAIELRKQVIFKIIPMINPDGVILGNFRTSLAGKDLNRQFKAKNFNLLPEINSLKCLIKKIKFQKTSKLQYFLDFHGHSIKKNVFVYGPQYDIWNLKYEKARILPRILAKTTQMFKLNFCHFKVANYKKATVRAFMLSLIPYCYTIQSSIGIYQDKSGQNIKFTIQKWNEMGYNIGYVLLQSIQKLSESTLNMNLGKKNKIKTKKTKQKLSKKQIQNENEKLTQKQNDNAQQNINFQKQKIITRQEKPRLILCQPNKYQIIANKQYLDPIRHIKNSSRQPQLSGQFCQKIAQQQGESDQQSDSKSDCQSQTNDFSKAQYQKLNKDIQKVIEDFKKVIEVVPKQKEQKNFTITNKRKTVNNEYSNKSLKKNTSPKNKFFGEEMKLVPSLRHKLAKINFSQKRIGANSLENSLIGNKYL